jgi:hypothetical protein
MQAQNKVIDLYQTDLDRHLYGMEPRRRNGRRGQQALFQAVAGWVNEWKGGWMRMRAAMANGAFFI